MLLIEGADRSLAGFYHSVVGRDPGYRVLAGRTGAEESGKQMAAFSVCFEVADPGPGYGHFSVCGWSGWAEVEDEILTIKTHWLLSVSVLDKNKEWAATNVGEDSFVRLTDDPREEIFKDFEAVKKLYLNLKRE